MEADGLFVYGSLREGGAHHSWLLKTHPQGHCQAKTRGRLFHLPMEGYPALVPDPNGTWVEGEFYGYEDEAELEAALSDLDALEGVEEEVFERRVMDITLEGGQTYQAWTYVFPEDRLPRLEREAVELTAGNWDSYLI